MRARCAALQCAALAAAASLGGCTGGSLTGETTPDFRAIASASASSTQPGFAISEVYGSYVLVYAEDNRRNAPARCRVSASRAAGIGSDDRGDLYVPVGDRIVEYAPNCGPVLARWTTPLKQIIDIAVKRPKLYAAGYGRGGRNVVAVCENATCDTQLEWPAISIIFGVAVDSGGNVWAAASTAKTNASLIVWRNGAMPGRRARGFANPNPGGLDFDNGGVLLAIDSFRPNVYGYRCDATTASCARTGTWPLVAESFFGKLDARNDVFEASDYNSGRVDVYRYPDFKFLYSYGRGLDGSLHVGGIAALPD